MALATGTKLGPYEVLSAIGAGGMGEVYRAKDTRLDRIVAIKVLPAHLSANEELKQRFEREAKTISSLSHPHICALYDIGHQNGTDFLVMEYLEGEPLVRRLEKGPLPTEQTLRYGVEIAEALDKAHRQGIVHRDLKPGNIMITKSGAKLLDFGLAKYQASAAQAISASTFETRDRPLTEEGMVLGTVQYMAPEQLDGKDADERTDIFALGELLYEMSTGQKTFKGNSKAQLISAILATQPPPITTIAPLSPPALEHVVTKCLAKEPDDRWQSAHDVASELKWISEQTSQSRMFAQPTKGRMKPASIAWMVASLFLLSAIALGIAAYHYFRQVQSAPTQELTELSFALPAGTTLAAPGCIALSPNGRMVAFSAITKKGDTSLWIRSLGSKSPHEFSSTADAGYPFWSPDSKSIGFFAQGKLKKIDVSGGPALTICDAPGGRGGTWRADGKILFSPNITGGLSIVSAGESGSPETVTTLDLSHQENSHRWPTFLPDGKHYLYTIRSATPESRGIYVGEIGSKEKRRILPDQARVEYVNGNLVIFRERNMLALPFDPARMQIVGEPTVLTEDVDLDPGLSTATYSVNSNTLAYMNSGSLDSILTWVDRSGRVQGTVGSSAIYFQPIMSPDEKKVAVGIPDIATGGYDVWIMDLIRGTLSRSTSNPASDVGAVWNPDSSAYAFTSNRSGNTDLYVKTLGGSAEEKLLLHNDNYKKLNDWSSDGRYILYQEIVATTNSDLWVLPMFGDRKPFPYLQSTFSESSAQFSPDVKWIAYSSDETGRFEIYVQSFPISTGTKRQVSTAGGDQVIWRRDQKELFYLAADGKLMAVPLSFANGFEPGVPVALFQTNFSYNTGSNGERQQYSVTADGQRFLLSNLAKQSSETPINLILNWPLLLKK